MRWPISRSSKAPFSAAVSSPREKVVILQLESDGMPEVWLVNQYLDRCVERAELTWHLSIIIEMQDVHENVGFPTTEEQTLLTALRETIETSLEAKENALFLGSVTRQGTRQLLYRVRDPERANAFLSALVADPAAVRPMEYRMEQDVEWALAERYLGAVRVAANSETPTSRLVRSGGKIEIVDD
ncbi:MAG: DUF695 domain-containing protein [Gemmatimonadaceae bacterium]